VRVGPLLADQAPRLVSERALNWTGKPLPDQWVGEAQQFGANKLLAQSERPKSIAIAADTDPQVALNEQPFCRTIKVGSTRLESGQRVPVGPFSELPRE